MGIGHDTVKRVWSSAWNSEERWEHSMEKWGEMGAGCETKRRDGSRAENSEE